MCSIQEFKDAKILKDFTKGSQANTFLIEKNSKKFFRKCACGGEINNLKKQIEWLDENKGVVNVTVIEDKFCDNNFLFYDMPYNENTINFFEYISKKDIQSSFNILKLVLEDMKNNMYLPNAKNLDLENLEIYLKEKVIKNIQKIKEYPQIYELLKYDKLIINGKEYSNLNEIEKYISVDRLYEIFKGDVGTKIHGDLTIENIICTENDYYLIDPNCINYHDSDNLDYSKVLQSLHGKYEYLMEVEEIFINKNIINFNISKDSVKYEEVLKMYNDYLHDNFSKSKVKSIYYHEIIHWIRLLSHKIIRCKNNPIIFYSQFIIIFNEIISMFKD